MKALYFSERGFHETAQTPELQWSFPAGRSLRSTFVTVLVSTTLVILPVRVARSKLWLLVFICIPAYAAAVRVINVV